MQEQIYDTLVQIISQQMPQSGGQAEIFDLPINTWYYGERDLTGIDTPAVLVKSQGSTPKDYAAGVIEYEHNLEFQVWTQAESRENSERMAQEAARVLNEAFLPHRRVWVLTVCPICLSHILSPDHFHDAHVDIIGSYEAAITTELATNWASTHSSGAPSPPESGLAAAAFLRMYNDVADPQVISIPNLSDAARTMILLYKNKQRRPVRLLYDLRVSEIKPSSGGEGQALLYHSDFTVTAKELVVLSGYGPDNVATGSQ